MGITLLFGALIILAMINLKNQITGMADHVKSERKELEETRAYLKSIRKGIE